MARRRASSRQPLTSRLPSGPVRLSTTTAELVPDPGDPRSVTLYLDGVPSSHVDLDDPLRLDFEYMQQMALVLDRLGADGGPLDVVHLGAAGCTLARYVHATRPRSRQLAVEIDAELAARAREWFELPRSPALRIRVGDAREVLATLPDASADAVVRDVFAGASTPEHLTTAEFTREVARVLRPEGVYLANVADRPPLAVARSELATIASVLPVVVLAAEPAQLRGRRYGNLLVAASRTGEVLEDPDLERAVRALPAPTRLVRGRELAELARSAPVRHAPPRDDDEAAPPGKDAASDDVRAVRRARRSPPGGPWDPA